MKTILLFCFFACSIDSFIVPSHLSPAPYLSVLTYTLNLNVGTPATPIILELTDQIDGIILFKDISKYSTSYIRENNEDVFYFSNKKFRIEFDYYNATSNLILELNRNCSYCDGLISTKKKDILYDLGSFFTMTYSSFYVNEIPFFMNSKQNSHNCNAVIIPCKESWLSNNHSTCNFKSTINDIDYNTTLSISSPFTYLPLAFYKNLLYRKNIYVYGTEWPILTFYIHDFVSPNHLDYLYNLGIDSSCSRDYFELDFSREIHYGFNGEKEFYIKPHTDPNDNTIIIGLNLLRTHVLLKNNIYESIVLQEHQVYDNVSLFNAILFLVLFFFFLWWKLSNTSIIPQHPIDKKIPEIQRFKIDKKDCILNIILEIISLGISIYAYFIPINSDVLENARDLHIILIVVLFVNVCVEIHCIVCAILTFPQSKYEKEIRDDVNKSKSLYMLNSLARNISHESTILNSLFLCLIERRTEGLSNLSLAFLSLYFIYNLMCHIIRILFVLIIRFPSLEFKNVVVWIYLFVIYPILSILLASKIYIYFIFYFMQRIMGLYIELTNIIFYGVLLIMFIFASMLNMQYVIKGKDRAIKRYNLNKKSQ